jgi:PAS domain S-box-containing protein
MEKIKMVSPELKPGELLLTPNGNHDRNHFLSPLFDKIASPVIYIGPDYRYKYVNKAYADLSNLSIIKFPGSLVSDFFGREAFARIKTCIDTALGGKEIHYEEEAMFGQNSLFIEAIYSPDFDENGAVKGCVVIINDISEKKRGKAEAGHSQKELQDYLDDAIIGQHWVNGNGIITWANKAELNMLGYSKTEYIGHPISEFHCDKKKIENILQRLFSKEEIHQYETEMLCKDGSVRSVMISSNVVWKNEEFIHTRCYTLDITAQKRAEKELKDSRAYYLNLIQRLPAAIYTTDKYGYITFYNEEAAKLWGRHPIIGKEMWCGSLKIFKPDGVTPLPLDTCPMAIALKEKRKVTGEEILVELPDGSRRNVLPHPQPLFDATGNITGAVNMLLDITDRNLSEEYSARLAAIVQFSEDAIISKTTEGIITSWNPAAERLYGFKEEEVIGKPIVMLIPKDRVNEEPAILERIKKGERVDPFETKRITKTGKLVDVSVTISPIKDKDGNVIGASKIAQDISKRIKDRRLIHENEERLRMASESAKMGIWEFHPETKKLTWSDECKKIYGLSAGKEPDNLFVAEHNHPEDKENIHREVVRAMHPDNDGNFKIEYRIIRATDNELRWLKVRGKVYFDDNEKPQRFIGTMLDITKEKLQQEELKESVELFQTMADNVPAMIWMSGTDKFNDYFNRTWLEYTGRNLEEECNDGWLEGVHPDDMQKCIDTYNDSLKEQNGFYTEYRLRRHDGQYRWIADNSIPRFSPGGVFLGFISACIDIDDQKMFREKILDSELLFKTISNTSPAALWMTDQNRKNVFVSDTWLKWTGSSFDEQIDRGWLSAVVEEDRERLITQFFECFEERKKFVAEFRVPRNDGSVRWCLTEGKPYLDINGSFTGYAGSVTDITEIKKLEQRKDDFIKMASHELKTPITSINGYVQLLLNIYNESESEKLQMSRSTVRSSLGTIAKQVTKLTRLISELLDLSKIESGKLELHCVEFNLEELVEETVQDIRHTTSRHAVIVESHFDGKMYGDKDRIGQVLTNLLNNAIKYSPDADRVEVFIEGNKRNASIRIKDYGIGIDKKEHQRIFERFYRVEGKTELTFPGFGIGLFIAGEIIQRHLGVIHIKSEKGNGSVFTINLPIDFRT